MSRPELLVDARNVLRSLWPNLREEEVVDGAARFARREGLQATIVFDGRSPAGPQGVEVVGTGAESADDWIARRAGELLAAGRAYWLVTSDRELRARARSGAARTIGGGSFAREISGRA